MLIFSQHKDVPSMLLASSQMDVYDWWRRISLHLWSCSCSESWIFRRPSSLVYFHQQSNEIFRTSTNLWMIVIAFGRIRCSLFDSNELHFKSIFKVVCCWFSVSSESIFWFDSWILSFLPPFFHHLSFTLISFVRIIILFLFWSFRFESARSCCRLSSIVMYMPATRNIDVYHHRCVCILVIVWLLNVRIIVHSGQQLH